MHKQGFQDLANRFGSRIPQAVNVRCEADLPTLATLRFPCVLKPAVKDYGYGTDTQWPPKETTPSTWYMQPDAKLTTVPPTVPAGDQGAHEIRRQGGDL